MAVCDNDSSALWIQGLRQGDPRVLKDLWDCYFPKLIRQARTRLGRYPKRSFDEEDLALSVFDTLYRGAKEGRFDNLHSRSNLWAILVAITRQKTADRIRRETRQKRGGGELRGDSVFEGNANERQGFERLADDEPTPEMLVSLDEEYRRLMGLLRDDGIRRIAALRLEGYSNDEIAQRLAVSVRAIQRKVRLIAECWRAELLP
jgi:RNA polymerase sigma factor (sigma-70 family)